MKRGMTICMVLLAVLSYSAAASQPSLLPLDRKWTVAQVRDLLAAGADVNARDGYGWCGEGYRRKSLRRSSGQAPMLT